jgi:hypothetical protein
MMVVIKLLLVVPPLMHLGKASMTLAACNKEKGGQSREQLSIHP